MTTLKNKNRYFSGFCFVLKLLNNLRKNSFNMSKKIIIIIACSVFVLGVGAVLVFYPKTVKQNQSVTSGQSQDNGSFYVYFSNGNKNLNKEDCALVFAVERKPSYDGLAVEAALKELLKGPTDLEKSQGYSSFFSGSTVGLLKKVKVADETAYVVFDRSMQGIISQAKSSCGSAQLLGELDSTLKQFTDIKNTVYSFDGNMRWFYGWLMMDCPEAASECDNSVFN